MRQGSRGPLQSRRAARVQVAQECVQLGDVGCGVFGVPLHADNGGIDRLDGLDRSVGSVSADLKAFGEACDALVVRRRDNQL